jgi:hypothetical protein
MNAHALLIENMCITVQGLHLKARKICITVHGMTLWVQKGQVSLRKILMMDLGHCQSGHLREAKQLIHHGHWKITVKEEFQGGMHQGRMTVLTSSLNLTAIFLTVTGLEMRHGCLVVPMESPLLSKEIGCFRTLRLMTSHLLQDPATLCGNHVYPHHRL